MTPKPDTKPFAQATCSTLLPGEEAAIYAVLRAAREYGHGNMIAHLRRDWAEILRDRWGMDGKVAIVATNSSPYPLRKARQWPRAAEPNDKLTDRGANNQ